MAATNAIDVILQATSPRLVATALGITANGGSFLKPKNVTAVSPTSITLTATTTGYTGTTAYQWSYATSLAPSTFTNISGATSSTYILANTAFISQKSTATYVVYKCTATQVGWASTSSTMQIEYSSGVNDTPVVVLSRDSIQLPTTASGVVDYANSGCNIRVSIAGTYIPYAASGNNTFSVAVAPNGITAGSASTTTSTVANDTRTFANVSAMGVGTAAATITYVVTVIDADGVSTNFTKTQTITKAIAGTSAVDINLSSTSVVLPASSVGVVSSFTNSGCNISVINNGVALTFVTDGSTLAGTFSVAVNNSNITRGAVSGAGTSTATFPNLSTFTDNSVGLVTYTITVYLVVATPIVYTRTQSFTQAKVGATGSTGNTAVFAYKVLSGTTAPTAPTIGINDGITAGTAITDSANWYTLPKTTLASNEWQFQVSGTVSSALAYTWQTQSYLSTFKVGKLSALSAQMGSVEVDSTGAVYSTGKASYNSTTAGFYLGYNSATSKYVFGVGDAYGKLTWDGSSLALSSSSKYSYVSLGGSDSLTPAMTILRTRRTSVPTLNISDTKSITVTSTAITTNWISSSNSLVPLTVNDPIVFNSTIGVLSAGVTYYVKEIDLINSRFKVSDTISPGNIVSLTNATAIVQGTLTAEVYTSTLVKISSDSTAPTIQINNADTGNAAALELLRGGLKMPFVFLNSTDPNTLDDYKEASWASTITIAGATGSINTSNTQYTKIGRLVHFNITITFNNSGSSGNITFTLPTTASISTAFTVFAIGTVAGFSSAVQAWSTANSGVGNISYVNSSTGALANDFATKVTSTTDLRISGTYW